MDEQQAAVVVVEKARELLDAADARMGWWHREAEHLWRAVKAYDEAVAERVAQYETLLAQGYADYEARAIVYEEPAQ